MTTRRVNLNTESVDNYLKAIYALGGPEEETRDQHRSG